MATINIHTCDACKKEVKKSYCLRRLHLHTIGTFWRDKDYTIDLCAECMEKVLTVAEGRDV